MRCPEGHSRIRIRTKIRIASRAVNCISPDAAVSEVLKLFLVAKELQTIITFKFIERKSFEANIVLVYTKVILER